MSSKKITILISIIYLIIGNIVGYGIYKGNLDSESLLSYLFYPYTFNWSLSSLVGADWLTFLFIVVAFLLSLAIFFPIGMFLGKVNSSDTKKKIFTFLFLFISTLFYSQETKKDSINSVNSFEQATNTIEITGTITELSDLPNIIVFEKGTDNMVKSDKDGKFLIKIPVEKFKNRVFLRFESLNMETKEVEIFQKSKNLKIWMKSNDLEENILAYQKQFQPDEPEKLEFKKIASDMLNRQIGCLISKAKKSKE